jgi:hypothetical protein
LGFRRNRFGEIALRRRQYRASACSQRVNNELPEHRKLASFIRGDAKAIVRD